MVQEVKDAVEEALRGGTTFEEFRKALSERVRQAWGEGSRHRLAAVFRTNLQLAYGAGRWKEAVETRALRPYWGLRVVLDGRTSEVCRPLAGVVLPADHPFWRTHIPPLHHGCRTALVSYTREEGERLAWREAPAHEPQAGFGRAPTAEEWSPDPKDYDPALWGQYIQALGRAYPGTNAYLADLYERHKAALEKGELPLRPKPTDWMFAAGRVAVAAFPDYPTKVRISERDLVGGEKWASSLTLHHRKRVMDGDIAVTASEGDYEATLRRAATDPEVGVVVYDGGKGPVIGVLAHTDWAVPEEARGPLAGPIWYVVYSLRSAVQVTAYSADSLADLFIPEDALWLRRPLWLSETP
nr:phage minor head protein [Thermus brevis]